jgi:hypothetical protein
VRFGEWEFARLMLAVRMDHGVRLFGRRELPNGRALMIDPDDGVIV